MEHNAEIEDDLEELREFFSDELEIDLD